MENYSGEGQLTEEERERLEGLKKGFEAAREQGVAITLNPSQLGLLHKMISVQDEHFKDQAFLLICDFVDREEALDHVAAYYEAKELGMDTGFNVAFMFALAASNDKGPKTNRVAQILDSLSHVKYTANIPKNTQSNPSIQRSPLSS